MADLVATGPAAASAQSTQGVGQRPKPAPKARAAKTGLQHGEAVLKVYPINEDALDNLGTLNRDFSVLLALSAGLAGFALDLSKDLVITTGTPLGRLAFAAGVNVTCWIIASLVAAAAIAKWREKGNRLKKIKEDVTFAE